MTGRVVNLGPKPGVAAAYKLFGNLTLIGMMGVVADVVRLAHAVGVAPADAVAMFKTVQSRASSWRPAPPRSPPARTSRRPSPSRWRARTCG